MIKKETRFLIIGLGLLGGSYALGLKKEGYTVYGIARRQETIDYALEHGIIDEGQIEVDEFVSKADVVIFGLYPTAMIEWVKKYKHLFKKNALITDVSGVKTNIVDVVQEELKDYPVEFLSCHPMAGRETNGIEYANTEMFMRANFIITPTEKNTPEAIEFCHDLAYTLHFNHIAILSCEEHDRMIGFLSQLTHVIAVSLMNTHDNSHLVEYTGDSFRDLTRIAQINENMWTELFLLNKEILLDETNQFIRSISHFRDALQNEDRDEMKRLFIQSTERRKLFNKNDSKNKK
ncbi:MAG: prephenate dehydrogenase/arogenate dehydrogenase family protein [Bacillota bacterium]|nr:prephenate dehydrogenase/arogenate dehydrogenase family protein [Bacillota bacterium]